jgi:hypothetical protein
MTVIPKWLKKEAEEQRRMRQKQPRISSAEAQRQFDRVMRASPTPVQSAQR